MDEQRKVKRALVTGGGTRVGKFFSLSLAQEGFDVAIHYGTNERGAKAAAHEITKLGRNAIIVQADFRLPEAAAVVHRAVIEQFDGLEVLVNNASIFPRPDALLGARPLASETVENWDETLAINARVPFFLMQKFASTLSKNGNGVIVNILDTSVSDPFLTRASYSISKATLAAVTKLGAKALAPHVRVNGIEFGAMLPNEGMSKEEQEKLTWGGVESAVNALLFVIKNDFVSGEIIPVRGGSRFAPAER